MSRRPFSKYPNKVLVETGSYLGEGVEQALNEGFESVISFEIVENLYNKCLDRFKNNPKVNLVLGSSATMLFDIIKNIESPITFWLDGHYSCGNTGYDKEFICPLIKELEQIEKHQIKNHTILIDDRRLMNRSGKGGLDGMFEVTEEEVIEKLKKINKNYVITYEDGHIANDIIVARISTKS